MNPAIVRFADGCPRVPRAGLSRPVVVAAAADLVDTTGFDRLTLAAVADRLGVRLPSLYKHIDSLDGLRRDLAVLAVTELGTAMGAAAVGGPGVPRCAPSPTPTATTGRSIPAASPPPSAHREPTTPSTAPPAEAVMRVVLAVLAGYGLSGDDAIDATPGAAGLAPRVRHARGRRRLRAAPRRRPQLRPDGRRLRCRAARLACRARGSHATGVRPASSPTRAWGPTGGPHTEARAHGRRPVGRDRSGARAAGHPLGPAALLRLGLRARRPLAAAFSASAPLSLLVGLGGGVSAFVLGLVAARVAFFAIGAVVGAVVGARLFAIVDRSDSNVLLALVFVPAITICGGVAVQRWRAGFLGWVTAIGGSALVLSGLGRLFPHSLGFLADPQTTAAQMFSTGVWDVLAVAARVAQRGRAGGG